MLQTVRVKKVDEKMRSFLQFSCFPPQLWSYKKTHFLKFCADFSKKPKSVKAIYILHLKVVITLFQKMMLVMGV